MLTAEEFIEKTINQRKRGRNEEALISAMAATDLEPNNANAWWQVALTYLNLNNTASAIKALRKTVELAPHFDTGWSYLGKELLKIEKEDEAIDAFQEAVALDEENIEALENIFKIYSKTNKKENDDYLSYILSQIEKISDLDSYQLNYYGIIHHRSGRPHEAIKYWRLAAAISNHPSSRFNLGLAYNNDQISQDADAIDMWRWTLRKWPDYEPPKKEIQRLLPRMLELASKARLNNETLLDQEQWYENYINPFELINIDDGLDLGDLDQKTIQKHKKRLLQEIDLEEGSISWLDGIIIDKSKAISICDELFDDQKRWFHWIVFKNKALLNFLCKGSHEHFLVNDDDCDLNTLKIVENNENGFVDWLNDYFANQFDRVLSKAISIKNYTIIECLLDGRRFVLEKNIDMCFINSQRAVKKILEPIKYLHEKSKNNKISIDEIDKAIIKSSVVKILNFLPTYFESHQAKCIDLIRDIAINCYNIHSDIDMSKEVINYAKLFKFRSEYSNSIIEKDSAEIETIIKKVL